MLKISRQDPSDATSDEALLAQYRRTGEAALLGRLFERYMPMVYGVCLKVLKDPGKAEDAVMGIYEELDRKLKNHAVEHFRGWLHVLARNYCLMEWRKTQRQPVQHHAPEDMARYDAGDMGFDYELPTPHDALEKCLGQLGPLQRQSVQWFYYENKSYKEIADMANEDLGKIRSHIQNGRRNLRICLEQHGVTGVELQ
jgi:RNA polymerase sigma-70 factor (ECF subfamily)